MQNLTLKIPDNKMDFFLELINNLGFVKVENQRTDVNVLSEEQIKLVEKERTYIKQNPEYLLDWEDEKHKIDWDAC